MRASRLLSLLIVLQMRGRVSAEALAREFEVSVRTIYRDMDQLSAAGVPVYAERGREGGFALLDGYRTKLTGFTSAEADALLLAGVGSAAADLGIGQELAAAQLKLLASLPPDSGASAQRVATRFHLDPVGWYSSPDEIEFLPAVAASVWSNKRIRIRYDSWKEMVTREVDPLGLVLKGGVWYLVAAVKEQPRTYRVSNIRSLDVTGEAFHRPAKFDLGRYWTVASKEFEQRLLTEKAVVELSPVGLRILRDANPTVAQSVDSTHAACEPEGWVRAEIAVESIQFSSRQLLRLGAEVKVIAPEALRDAVAEEARKVASLYSQSPKHNNRARVGSTAARG